MLEQLKENVCLANLELVSHGLVIMTWGNVSGFDSEANLIVIKPSGVSYDNMEPSDMVVVDLEGKVVEGKLNPSSDTPTHLELYRRWPELGGIVHTHSSHAVMFAQALKPVPCFGTTHADHFYGQVPVTRELTEEEVKEAYEVNTGKVIIETFENIKPLEMPSVLCANHGPFSWGEDPFKAVKNAVALEEVARMALGTMQLNPEIVSIPEYILEKHYSRKHGPGAYYGQ